MIECHKCQKPVDVALHYYGEYAFCSYQCRNDFIDRPTCNYCGYVTYTENMFISEDSLGRLTAPISMMFCSPECTKKYIEKLQRYL